MFGELLSSQLTEFRRSPAVQFEYGVALGGSGRMFVVEMQLTDALWSSIGNDRICSIAQRRHLPVEQWQSNERNCIYLWQPGHRVLSKAGMFPATGSNAIVHHNAQGMPRICAISQTQFRRVCRHLQAAGMGSSAATAPDWSVAKQLHHLQTAVCIVPRMWERNGIRALRSSRQQTLLERALETQRVLLRQVRCRMAAVISGAGVALAASSFRRQDDTQTHLDDSIDVWAAAQHLAESLETN